MPTRTSVWLFGQIHSHLVFLRDSNCEVFSPNQFAVPAAMIQTLVNGAICTRLPSWDQWIHAYENNVELCLVRELVQNPPQITNKRLSKVNHTYRWLLRQSQILIEDGMFILQEPICSGTSYTHLQLVPRELRNILFIVFHTNAIGGHLNAYRTLHRLCLHFYWPGMFGYIKCMCLACPGCALSNPSHAKSSELVYNFPIEAPFWYSTLIHTLRESMPVSRVWTRTSSVHAVCVALPIWNQSLTRRPRHLLPPSCASYFGMGSATQRSLIKIASSLASAARHWTFYKFIVTSYQVQTTTPCLSSKSINT